MSSSNVLTGSSAPQSSWPGESAHNSTVQFQHMFARPGVPLDECGFPSHSYRYHTLRLQELEIEQTIKKIGQDFDDGILDFDQWRVLDRHWTDKERAVSKQIDEEMKTGPQSLEELLQSWGYTDGQATLMVRQNLDTRLESHVRSHRHLYRRNIRGD
ncbi:hypothetical protein EVG20_g5762 [Dentipellis fragilis]|uniref:Uncharacterized protein n=1 Tax=Dentipellis fragilis TaxID=205917 RepID=A0A4Y9YT93_9AGAM|nr:hypothetical protein EVG20_g5762 [Dentipellis fragilis]